MARSQHASSAVTARKKTNSGKGRLGRGTVSGMAINNDGRKQLEGVPGWQDLPDASAVIARVADASPRAPLFFIFFAS